MNPPLAAYNERSWAIDVIGHIKHITRQTNRAIKDAGGEQTIRSEGGALFPDVLLFGDRATARILQGWELKLPDTSISDGDFRLNAESKARALGLDSFLLWNVSHAYLYVRDVEADEYILKHAWSDLSDIKTRSSVVSNRRRWEQMAAVIVSYLNDLFDSGSLEGRQFIEAYRSGGITTLIMQNTGLVEQALTHAANTDPMFRARMTIWWHRYQREYGGTTMAVVLAQAVLANWIGKFLFAHLLSEKDTRARRVAEIQSDSTPQDALAFFHRLSQDCNFWTIFSDNLGLSALPDRPWRELKEFNRLLADLRIGTVDQTQLAGILEATVEVARRKLRGQYPTPMPLARLLVHLCVRNIESDRLLDPCCGSGTIARAALEYKLGVGVSAEDACASIFAGDQDPQATQIATFALAKPHLMNYALRIFQQDAFSLTPTTAIEFRHPMNGTRFVEELGRFDAISCNLPFVSQAGRSLYGHATQIVSRNMMKNGISLSGRADVAAYLPFSLHPLLKDRGRLGIIMTNAWSGTDWGDSFCDALDRYYDLKCVITSGAGRWFQSSDVVTNILILEKKDDPDRVSGEVKFVVLRRPLEEFEEEEDQGVAAAQIELGQPLLETMSIRSVRPVTLARFRTCGLGGNAQFVNSDWVLDLPLARLSGRFSISRGERRGMNSLFYPTGYHGIEPEYIRPLAKGPADFTRLRGQAARVAFCCSRSEAELRELGHFGALQWIRRFKTSENELKLTRPDAWWYEMNADSLTELVMFINYGERLFVARLEPPAFVDQRMVRLMPRGNVDVDLYHALLNSAIGLFLIEGLGFGRGLGALDLSKDRIEAYSSVLDGTILGPTEREGICRSFFPLVNRDILGVPDELEQGDRRAFDDAIIDAFGLRVSREQIYDSLRDLFSIRATASD